MVRVVVDSTADISPGEAAELGITVVPILVQFGNETYQDTDLPRDTFYSQLIEAQQLPRTAAPPLGVFEAAFRGLAEQGFEIFSLSVAEGLSSTYNAARQAAGMIEGARIVACESGTASAPYGFIARALARAAQAGASLNDLQKMADQLRHQTTLVFAVDTLRYLEKGGRIGRIQAFLGTVLSVKPVVEVRLGQVLPLEQVRLSKRVPARLVEIAQCRGPFNELSVIYTTDRAAAERLADLMAAAGLQPREQIRIVQVGPALGTHTGPGALGFAGLLP